MTYTDSQREQMLRGKAPTGSDGWPMEWHHKVPLNRGGHPTDRSNLEPMTRTEHRGRETYEKHHPE